MIIKVITTILMVFTGVIMAVCTKERRVAWFFFVGSLANFLGAAMLWTGAKL